MKLVVLLVGLVLCTGLDAAFPGLMRPGVEEFEGALTEGTEQYNAKPDSRGSSNPVESANPVTSLKNSVSSAGLGLVGTLLMTFISSYLLSNPWILIIYKVISMLLASIKK